MLPESLIMIYFCWGVSIVTLILGDEHSLEKSWVNAKLKWIGILFSSGASIFSVLPQRYDLQTSANTIVYYNQTVDLNPPGAGGLTTPIDFTRFVISILLTVLCSLDLIITFMEDPL